jgi:Lrp/AsnC family leucine-responsive transcriptional regulator
MRWRNIRAYQFDIEHEMAESLSLDRIDLRLLALLQQDGRATNAEIAGQVNLSPSACLRRIQRLETAGVIRGYAALVDPKSVGLGLQAFVRVQLEKHGQLGLDRFIEGVNSWDEVVAALTGDMDYLLHVVVQDLEHFSQFLLDKLINATGVADVNSSFVLRTVKQTRALPLGHLA